MQPVDIYLIRGLAREAVHWGEFRQLLEKEKFCNSITCLDLPGAGRFHQLSSPLTISAIASFLLTQVDSSSNHPKVIISISLGSMVAVEMGLQKPELFSKIYVMNTSFSNLSPFYHRLQLNGFKQLFRIALSKKLETREREVLKMVSQRPELWDSLLPAFVQAAERRPFSPLNLLRQLWAAATYKIPSHSPDCPIVVMNSLGDQMVHSSCSEQLAQHWGLKQYTHPTAGHDIAIDQPEWIIETILSDRE